MRFENFQRIGGGLLLLGLAAGCSSVLLPEMHNESPLGIRDPESAETVATFSDKRAWDHLLSLTQIGARDPGSEGNSQQSAGHHAARPSGG